MYNVVVHVVLIRAHSRDKDDLLLNSLEVGNVSDLDRAR